MSLNLQASAAYLDKLVCEVLGLNCTRLYSVETKRKQSSTEVLLIVGWNHVCLLLVGFSMLNLCFWLENCIVFCERVWLHGVCRKINFGGCVMLLFGLFCIWIQFLFLVYQRLCFTKLCDTFCASRLVIF
jgi:hypothetical protein